MSFRFNPFTSKLDIVTDPAGSTPDVQINNGGAFGNVPSNTTPTLKYLSQINTGTPMWEVIPSAGALTYYFQDTASDISTYKQMLVTPFTPKTTLTSGSLSGTSVLINFATNAGVPNLTFIPAGQYEFHIHAAKASGTKATALYAEFWEVSSLGVDIGKIGTSETSSALVGSETEYRLFFSTANVYNMASANSRIDCRIYTVVTGGGSAPTVSLYYGDEADSHISLPSNTVDASNFVPYTGAVSNVNLGTHGLIATGVTNSSLTAGRIPFSGTAGLETDDSNLVWDNTNKRLGLNQGTPLQTFDETGVMMVRGTYLSGETLGVSGAGARMFYYPKKAAFRAGLATGSEWDDANIGNKSLAIGTLVKADHDIAIAIGDQTSSTASGAIAVGSLITNSATHSISMGAVNTINSSDAYSVLIGSNSTLNGASGNVAIGTNNNIGSVIGVNGAPYSSVILGSYHTMNAFIGVAVGYSTLIEETCELFGVAIGTALNLNNAPNGNMLVGMGPLDFSGNMVNSYDKTLGLGINASVPTVWITDGQTGGGYVGIGQTDPTTITEKLQVNGNIKASGYKSSDGSAGINGTITTASLVGKTVTIKNGLITNIS